MFLGEIEQHCVWSFPHDSSALLFTSVNDSWAHSGDLNFAGTEYMKIIGGSKFFFLFFKFFWRTSVLFVGPLIPLFWTVCLGFQSQSRSPHLRALAVKPFLSTYLVVVSSNYRPQTKSASMGVSLCLQGGLADAPSRIGH